MAKPPKTEPPRIFISHAWEDKTLVRQLEKALAEAGAEVWVDHAGIRGGDNLPERINDALEWCNTLLLLWSKAAKTSRWVKLEWTSAISSKRIRIIPCLIDKTPLPFLLNCRVYIDLSDQKQGLVQLLQTLRLSETDLYELTIWFIRALLIDGFTVPTVEKYEFAMRSFLDFMGNEHFPSDKITKKHLHDHHQHLLDTGKSKVAANKQTSLIEEVFKIAFQKGVLNKYPF